MCNNINNILCTANQAKKYTVEGPSVCQSYGGNNDNNGNHGPKIKQDPVNDNMNVNLDTGQYAIMQQNRTLSLNLDFSLSK